MTATEPKATVIIVSFNTKGLLDRCFNALRESAGNVPLRIIVVDNSSSDGSAAHIRTRHPDIVLVESAENIGFAAANNRGFAAAAGAATEYVILLNTDAFPVGDAVRRSIEFMDERPEIGLAGGRLIGEDGSWQPSARVFPGIWNDFLTLSGLAARRPRSRFFGRPDMTWADQSREILCDWVPGAFVIVRRAILDRIGFFDERFFLYSEEVDLCRRIKSAGWKIAYRPEIVVVHVGGASTSMFSKKLITRSGMQMGLWRLQSQYLYYRKHYGFLKAAASRLLEEGFNLLRLWRNTKRDPAKAEESRIMLDLIRQAWKHTQGGRVSPLRPWQGI